MYAFVRVHVVASHLMDHERGRGRACLMRRPMLVCLDRRTLI